MSGLVTEPTTTSVAPRSVSRSQLAVRIALFLALALGLGAGAGVIWWVVVDLPAYMVNPEGGATINERGLAEFIATDAWFSAIGLVVGLALGVIGWRFFRGIGWAIVPLVLISAIAAELVCWLVGYRLGPGEFAPRLAAAHAGQLVPIELTLRAKASLLTWPFFAVAPVLVGASLGRDDEDPRPLFRRRTTGAGENPKS
jgi:hypothetical protein